jgi:outer membrane lipoprotein-sorting protein
MAWILVTLLLLPTMAYAQPSAAEVLQRVKAAYGGARQFQFASRVIERRSGSETTGLDEIAVDSRGRLWFKAEGPAAVQWSGGAEATAVIVVADGRAVWVYLEGRKEYKKADGAPDPKNADSDDDSIDNPRSIARKIMDSLFVRYEMFQNMASQAKLVREETCTANGARSTCYVLEINAKSLNPDVVTGTYTLWVDKQRYLVLRDDFRQVANGRVAYANSILFDVAKVDAPIADKLFSFVPQQGAKEVDSFFR